MKTMRDDSNRIVHINSQVSFGIWKKYFFPIHLVRKYCLLLFFIYKTDDFKIAADFYLQKN